MSEAARLLELMARLRDPESGCPWDLAQTFESIVPHTIEEAYEVADAIDRGDSQELKEELGDMLLQVVFYARIAEERGLFDFPSVVEAISDKLVRRHPHVFADAEPASEAERAEAWESEKAREREQRSEQTGSRMDGVARALPALVRARKLQERAARAGFDWPEAGPVRAKVQEELAEVQAEVEAGYSRERLQQEIGDVLFSVVNLGRHLRVDAEEALRQTNQRFEQRFRAMEARLVEEGRDPEECTLGELDQLWEAVKLEEA